MRGFMLSIKSAGLQIQGDERVCRRRIMQSDECRGNFSAQASIYSREQQKYIETRTMQRGTFAIKPCMQTQSN
jgi:hypothetical protein